MRNLITVLLLVFSFTTQAQFKNTLQLKEGQTSPNATLQDVSWIQGHWTGNELGGTVEEVWTAPLGDSMMGSFKLVSGKNNKVGFYEIMILRQVEETILMQLKHFNGDLKGWEEKNETVDFKLLKVTPNKVFFDGLTFEKVDKNHMNVYVIFKSKEQQSEMKFAYQRVVKD